MARTYERLRRMVDRKRAHASRCGPTKGSKLLMEALELDGKAHAVLIAAERAGYELIQSPGGITWRPRT